MLQYDMYCVLWIHCICSTFSLRGLKLEVMDVVCYAPGLVVWRIAVHASNRSRSRRPFISKAIFLLNS